MYYLTHTIKSNFQAIYGIFILNVVRDSWLQGFIMLGCEVKGLSVHTQRAVAQQRAGKPQNPDRETEPLPQFQPGLSWECHQLWARVDVHHGAPAHHLTDWWGLLLAGLLESLWGAEKSIWGLCKIYGIFRNQSPKQLWVGYWGDQMGHKLATKGITRSKPPAGDTIDCGVSQDQFVCMFLSAWGNWRREDQREDWLTLCLRPVAGGSAACVHAPHLGRDCSPRGTRVQLLGRPRLQDQLLGESLWMYVCT